MRSLLAATLAGLVLLTGCSPNDGDPTAEETAAETPSPFPTPTEAPSTTETSPSEEESPEPSETWDEDQVEAAAVVEEFLRLYDELPRSLDSDLQLIVNVTTGQAQTDFRLLLIDWRDQGLVVTGERMRVNVEEVSDTSEIGGDPHVTVQACTDEGGSEIVYHDSGEPYDSDIDYRFLRWEFDVLREQGSNWLVGEAKNDIVEDCDPA